MKALGWLLIIVGIFTAPLGLGILLIAVGIICLKLAKKLD